MLRTLATAARRARTPQGASVTGPARRYAADAHGEVKYNAWEKPTEIAKWKEEHIVFAVLGGWAVVIYGAMKTFGGGQESDKKTAKANAEQ